MIIFYSLLRIYFSQLRRLIFVDVCLFKRSNFSRISHIIFNFIILLTITVLLMWYYQGFGGLSIRLSFIKRGFRNLRIFFPFKKFVVIVIIFSCILRWLISFDRLIWSVWTGTIERIYSFIKSFRWTIHVIGWWLVFRFDLVL